jgi:hypothetical protein
MADRRLHLLVEGQTEELVVDQVIKPHLSSAGWLVTNSILATRRPAGGSAHRGGVTSWSKLSREITRLLNDSSLDVLTTVIDYYAFPADAPGMATRPVGDALCKVRHVERELAAAIGDRRFLPHLTLHEVEAWVFAAATELGALYGDAELAARLHADAASAGGPELVNDGVNSAPSKRLVRYRPGYAKTVDGPLAIAELGLPALRRRCPHLDVWLARLDQSRGR